MNAVRFYKGKIGNNNGDKLNDILTWGFDRLEVDHSYIQWLFPLQEESMFNSSAPILSDEERKVFEEDGRLRLRVVSAFFYMLTFWGFKVVEENKIVIQEMGEHHADPEWVFKAFNHNMLRISRVLRSLRLMGLSEWSLAFYNALKLYKDQVSENTWSYWEEAALGPLDVEIES